MLSRPLLRLERASVFAAEDHDLRPRLCNGAVHERAVVVVDTQALASGRTAGAGRRGVPAFALGVIVLRQHEDVTPPALERTLHGVRMRVRDQQDVESAELDRQQCAACLVDEHSGHGFDGRQCCDPG